MLTRIPIELIAGNGLPNMLLTNIGSSLDVSDVKAVPGISIIKSLEAGTTNVLKPIHYDPLTGIMNFTLSNGQEIKVKGFVKATNMRRGPQGNAGRTGLNGLNGLNGVDGMAGALGPVGYTGLRGQDGMPGPKGIRGDTGPVGYPGIRGSDGLQGAQGKYGAQGVQGDQGEIGRDGYLPITISDGDPGAIGAGSLWVKPAGFVYGDPVNFTVDGTIEELVCRDTLNMLNITSSGGQVPDWWTIKEIPLNEFETLVASYKCSTLYQDGLVVIADFETSVSKSSCVWYSNGKIVNLGTLLVNPKCCADDKVYVLDDNKLYIVAQDIQTIDLKLTNINDVFVFNGTLYISSQSGFYTYKTQLNRYLDTPCYYALMREDYFYLVGKSTTCTNLKDTEYNIDAKAIVSDDNTLLFLNDGQGIAVSEHTNGLNLLWQNPNLGLYSQNILDSNGSYYVVTLTGPKFVVDTLNLIELHSNWIIEYSDNQIFITRRS